MTSREAQKEINKSVSEKVVISQNRRVIYYPALTWNGYMLIGQNDRLPMSAFECDWITKEE